MMASNKFNAQRDSAASSIDEISDPIDGSQHPIDLASIESCVGGGDPRISELVEEARRAGYPVTERTSSIRKDVESSRFRPDGFVVE
jgi:hypothetical protein